MAEEKQHAVILAPYWQQPGNLGHVRTERFVRWLTGRGWHVSIVSAGSTEKQRAGDGWQQLQLRDPFGFYRDYEPDERPAAIPLRKQNALRRAIAYLLFCPDPVLPWARAAGSNDIVRQWVRDADIIISSSPPESGHVAAERLSRLSGTPLLVDLRDGWMDDPIIPLADSIFFQRWRQLRLEKRVLNRSSHITVTTAVWRDKLLDRYPHLEDRVTVLTNALPADLPRTEDTKHDPKALELIYAGKISGSRLQRHADELLLPLISGLEQNPAFGGTIRFVGNIGPEERGIIESRARTDLPPGWRMRVENPVPRDQLVSMLARSSGLLLLESLPSPVPGKLYEYLAARRPVLAVVPVNSAVENLTAGLPHLFFAHSDRPQTVEQFLMRCTRSSGANPIPEELTDSAVSQTFMQVVDQLLDQQ